MKTIICYLIASILCLESYSQSYLTDESKWNYTEGYFDGIGGIHNEYITYHISGDTIINSVVYKKLHKSGVDSITHQNPSEPDRVKMIDEYYMAIREESKNIYGIYSSKIEEFQFFDFNLSVGDTLEHLKKAQNCPDIQTVSAIEFVSFGGQQLKKYLISGGSNKSFIEGIGGSNGFTGEFCQAHHSGGSLVCYTDGVDVYQASEDQDCFTISSTSSIDERLLHLKLYPNPNNGIFKIEIDNNKTPLKIKIFDSLGREVYTKEFIQTTSFQLNHLQQGIYTARVLSNDQIITKNFIIQKD